MTMVSCLVATAIFLTSDPTPQEGNLAELLPRIAAKEPAEALKTFHMQHGFSMQLVASEPDVTDPVDAAFDERGRLWVVEMRGYPFPEDKPIGRVRILEDKDDDGVYESSRVFAENLNWPTGIALWKGGCFVCVAPDLIYLPDADHDGKADERQVYFTGFGHDNVQALLNCPRWGIDGRLTVACSANGGNITSPKRPDMKPLSVRGHDLAFDPETGECEAISGGAQFGNTFDDEGRRFICSNSNHVIQVVMEAKYFERNPAMTAPNVLASVAVDGGAAPVFRISQPEPWRVVRTARRKASGQTFAPTELFVTGYFTSASGITAYRGDAYPPDFKGNLFIGDVGGNLIHRKRIEAGNSIEVKAVRADEKAEFIASTDNWFRPVNFVNAPDGTLYVLDMYRETIEHPWSIPEDIKAHLDLTSGKDRGRVYRIAPPDFRRRATPDLSKVTSGELAELLSHPNLWHRETAQRLLQERKGPETLAAVKERWGAVIDQDVTGKERLLTLLARNGAIDRDMLLNAIANEKSLPSREAMKLATPLINSDQSIGAAIAKKATSLDANARFLAVVSLQGWKAKELVPALDSAMASGLFDPTMRFSVVATSFEVAPEMISNIAGVPCLPWKHDAIIDLARAVGIRNIPEEIKTLLEVLQKPRAEDLQNDIVSGFVEGLHRKGVDWRKAVAGIEGGARFIAFIEDAPKRASDANLSPRERQTSVQMMSMLPFASTENALVELLNPRQPSELQLAALKALSAFSDAAVAKDLLAVWPSASPLLRSELAEALLARADRQKALLDAVDAKQIPAGDLSAQVRERLQGSKDKTIAERARKRLGQPDAARQKVYAAYRPALDAHHDVEAGRKVLERECLSCHKLADKGHEVGPTLATIKNRTAEQLLQHIIDPNLEVLPAYQEYAVMLNDGRVASGIIASESGNSVTLKRAEGATETIPRDQIEEIKSSGRSLMPVGLEEKIKPEEMANLIWFLLEGK